MTYNNKGETCSVALHDYIDSLATRIVWKNVVFFTILHIIHIYSLYLLIATKAYKTWIFHYCYGFLGGLGVTAGAHRLWSHRSYKANLALRTFLCMCHCIAGQDDLYTWCRDHRLHHKFSDTDADPHNSKRGFFFAHMGWLLVRKHPQLITKGKQLDHSDLLQDPVVVFQKRNYRLLYTVFIIVLPTLIPIIFWDERWSSALILALMRYTTALHCTWFVNSAAHLWGDRPYNVKIEPRENKFVSYGAFGEGFHNYHHTFPFDYATSESGSVLNPSKIFIDIMARLGYAYGLKRVTIRVYEERKSKVHLNSTRHFNSG